MWDGQEQNHISILLLQKGECQNEGQARHENIPRHETTVSTIYIHVKCDGNLDVRRLNNLC